MIKIKEFIFNDFQENTYVLSDETNECVIIDPGCHYPNEKKQLEDYISDNNFKPVKLLNTHCHIDHILGNSFVADKYNLALTINEGELKTYEDTGRWGQMFGMQIDEMPSKVEFIDDGDTISFGNSELKVLLTPGHSIASVCFYSQNDKIVIAGDVIFLGSIGRTDLPGGNLDILLNSIRTKLFVLTEDVKLYPGHGPSTTVGFEKANNPFLK